jgi:hypothetical protein
VRSRQTPRTHHRRRIYSIPRRLKHHSRLRRTLKRNISILRRRLERTRRIHKTIIAVHRLRKVLRLDTMGAKWLRWYLVEESLMRRHRQECAHTVYL